MSKLVGKTVDRYFVKEYKGHGDFGAVYVAKHIYTSATIALKRILPPVRDKKSVEELTKEARISWELEHPNIAKVHDCFEFDKDFYIVYDFVEGNNLEEILRDTAVQFTPEQFFSYSQQLLSALSYAHNNKVVHRDIKQRNIIITPEGIVKMTDFGMAAVVGDAALQGYHTSSSLTKVLSEDTRNPKFDVYCAGDLIGCLLKKTEMDSAKRAQIEEILNTRACIWSQEKRCTAAEFLKELTAVYNTSTAVLITPRPTPILLPEPKPVTDKVHEEQPSLTRPLPEKYPLITPRPLVDESPSHHINRSPRGIIRRPTRPTISSEEEEERRNLLSKQAVYPYLQVKLTHYKNIIIQSDIKYEWLFFGDSFQKLREKGYERHLFPWESFGLLIDHFERRLQGLEGLERTAQNMLNIYGEWFHVFIEVSNGKAVFYIPKNYFEPRDAKYNDEMMDEGYIVNRSKLDKHAEFSIKGIPLKQWVDLSNFGDDFVSYLYTRPFDELPKVVREGGKVFGKAQIYLPLQNRLWPVTRSAWFNVDCFMYGGHASRGARVL